MSPEEYTMLLQGFNAYTVSRASTYRNGVLAVKASIALVFDDMSVTYLEKMDTSDPLYTEWLAYINQKRAIFELPPIVGA